MKCCGQEPYYKHFIFFKTKHMGPIRLRVAFSKVERLSGENQSSLLGSLVSYEENEAL
jgi:hypothetical protein